MSISIETKKPDYNQKKAIISFFVISLIYLVVFSLSCFIFKISFTKIVKINFNYALNLMVLLISQLGLVILYLEKFKKYYEVLLGFYSSTLILFLLFYFLK